MLGSRIREAAERRARGPRCDSELIRRRRRLGCHDCHPISPLRCIVVPVDARNFRQNATARRWGRRETHYFSANVGSTRCDGGSVTRIARNALFPACKSAISDLSSSTGERSTTMDLVSGEGSDALMEGSLAASPTPEWFAFSGLLVANSFHFASSSNSVDSGAASVVGRNVERPIA